MSGRKDENNDIQNGFNEPEMDERQFFAEQPSPVITSMKKTAAKEKPTAHYH